MEQAAVKIVTLERKEAEAYIARLAHAHVAKNYPGLKPQQQSRLIKKLAVESRKNLLMGGNLTLQVPPDGKWQAWKDNHAPYWFKKIFPVRYQQI